MLNADSERAANPPHNRDFNAMLPHEGKNAQGICAANPIWWRESNEPNHSALRYQIDNRAGWPATRGVASLSFPTDRFAMD